MQLLDIVVSQVEQTEIHHLAQSRRLREFLQIVVAHIENLESFTSLFLCQTSPVASQLVGRDTLASCQVHRLQGREIVVEVWNATDLWAVVKLDVRKGCHLVPCILCKLSSKLTVNRIIGIIELRTNLIGCNGRVTDIELLQLGKAIDGLRHARDSVGQRTNLCILQADAAILLDSVLRCHLRIGVVAFYNHLRHVGTWVILQELALIVMAHRGLLSRSQTAGIIVIEDVGTNLLIVRTEVEHLEFCQLSDGIRHNALGTEASDDETDDTAVAVERYARLVAPHIEFLVEVPVGTLEGSIAIEAPLLTLQRFPDGFQGLIVLDVLLGLGKQDRHLGTIIELIILYYEGLTLDWLGFILGLHRTRLTISGVRSNLIGSGREPYGRIAVGCAHLHILVVGIVRILMFLAYLLILHLHLREGNGFAGKEVGYADIHQTDIREEILGTTGTGLLPLLNEIELHLASLHGGNAEVLNLQSATCYRESFTGRRSQQLLIHRIIEIETDNGIGTGSKLQFFTSQTILGILCVVGIEHQGLRNRGTVMLHDHLDFLGIIQFLKLVNGNSTRSP